MLERLINRFGMLFFCWLCMLGIVVYIDQFGGSLNNRM